MLRAVQLQTRRRGHSSSPTSPPLEGEPSPKRLQSSDSHQGRRGSPKPRAKTWSEALSHRSFLNIYAWLSLSRGSPRKVYGYAFRHRGELVALPWPPNWSLELHHDPYRDARAQTVWSHRWGWPATHVTARTVRDCGECKQCDTLLSQLSYPINFLLMY